MLDEVIINSGNPEEKILENLNKRQLEAVISQSPSTLVIAGAGSGKTAVLTRRVAYLIARGETPGKIVCLTFTNKAASEMNTRVRDLLKKVDINLPFVPPWSSDYTNSPLLCTFHALGVKILREFGDELGFQKDFNILDSSDQKTIIKETLKELNVDPKQVNPSLVSYFISSCKQELLEAKDSQNLTKDFLPVFHNLYKKYEQKLKKLNAVDFDDLILKTYLLLANFPEVRQILHRRFQHVLVDEFQDTNPAQFEIIKLLLPVEKLLSQAAEESSRFPESLQNGAQETSTTKQNYGIEAPTSTSLFVVGDDAQSIYGFRGSKIEIILNFNDYYPGTKEIILNQNYRSTQPILDLAEQVLTLNPGQKKKSLFTDNPEKVDIHYYLASDQNDEAEYIIDKLKDLYVHSKDKKDKKTDQSEIAETVFVSDEVFEKPKIKPTSTPKNNDPVSSMFDMYFQSDDTYQASQNYGLQGYNPNSWQVKEVNWKEIKDLNNCVVLYRTHAQSRSLEEVFIKNNLPYRLVSGVRFLDRKEVKDVLAILKFSLNQKDYFSLNRFLSLITKGMGPKTLEKINQFLDGEEVKLAPKVLSALQTCMEVVGTKVENSQTLVDLTGELITALGYEKHLKEKYSKDDAQTKMENIRELYSIMKQFDEDEKDSLNEKLEKFLQQISLMSNADDAGDDTPKINLMSLHQSKGLEFETVFLVGVEEGILPHINAFEEPMQMQEEVRLAYVGVTRAKKHLYLISADSRLYFGQIRANRVSRIFRPFLDSHCIRSEY